MKWLLCENNKADSKYWQGRQCHEEVLVDDNATKAVCWRCVAVMVPVESPKPKTGYPRGWKFMAEFVDKEGNVYQRGLLKPELFGSKEPTPLKEPKKIEKKKKVDGFEEKVMDEIHKRMNKNKTKPKKTTKVAKDSTTVDKFFGDTAKKPKKTKTKSVPKKTKAPAKKKVAKKSVKKKTKN